MLKSLSHRIMKAVGNYLFPVVLISGVIASMYMQPPLISAPEVEANFQKTGSQPGFFASADNKFSPWPANLPPRLIQALKASFGPQMPEVESYYFFGQAYGHFWNIPAVFGAETVLSDSGHRVANRSMALFGFQIRLVQSGRSKQKSWYIANGDHKKVEPNEVLTASWLERAALLLPLATARLNWIDNDPNGLMADLDGIGRLEIDFKGKFISRIKLGNGEMRLSKPLAFGQYILPSNWEGRWEDNQLTGFDITGLVFNPPFAAKALKGFKNVVTPTLLDIRLIAGS